MRKSLYLLFLLIAVTGINFSYAQIQRCGTYELHKYRMQTDPIYKAYYENIDARMQAWQNAKSGERTTEAIVTIPVVVHVLYNTTDQNIPDAQILSQIDILNHDYTATNSNINQVPPAFQSVIGNANLNFCLATIDTNGNYTTGIERKYTSIESFGWGDNSLKFDSLGGLNAWNRNQYLNLWVCNMSGGLLGYTEMWPCPAQLDGCVILYTAFGNTGDEYATYGAYNLGRTATHEIGHWLGLFHVWGDGSPGQCLTDHIADTPPQSQPTFGCPAYPLTDVCSPNAPGVMFMNYLDYTDDRCMSMFSADQVAVMYTILDSDRTSILTSKGCTAPNGLTEINGSTFIDLYPNPAGSSINIAFHLSKASVLNVTVWDILGKEALNAVVNKAGEQNINLNTSSLPSGLYTLIVKTDQGNIAKRFAVTH